MGERDSSKIDYNLNREREKREGILCIYGSSVAINGHGPLSFGVR